MLTWQICTVPLWIPTSEEVTHIFCKSVVNISKLHVTFIKSCSTYVLPRTYEVMLKGLKKVYFPCFNLVTMQLICYFFIWTSHCCQSDVLKKMYRSTQVTFPPIFILIKCLCIYHSKLYYRLPCDHVLHITVLAALGSECRLCSLNYYGWKMLQAL